MNGVTTGPNDGQDLGGSGYYMDEQHNVPIYKYVKDCEQMIAFFGPDKKLINILPAYVAKFYKSDALLKIPKNGKERAPKTINKTKMVFKGLLNWAKEQGHIEGLPLPKSS